MRTNEQFLRPERDLLGVIALSGAGMMNRAMTGTDTNLSAVGGTGYRMKQPLNIFRLLTEIIIAIAVAEAGVMFLLPVVAPGVEGTLEAMLDATMLSVLSGPVILWRVMAAVKRANTATTTLADRSAWFRAGITTSVFVASLSLTLSAAFRVNEEVKDKAKERFDHIADRVVTEARRRVNLATYGLMGARGVYATCDSIKRSSFAAYVDSRNLESEFPGVIGLGVIEHVQRADLDRFIAAERADDAPDFSVWGLADPGSPLADAADLYVIKHCYPKERNAKAWGLDVGSDVTRREAIEQAIATGEPTITGNITLVQDGRKHTGFLYYVPIYQRGTHPQTAEERRLALRCVIYAPIILDDMLAGLEQETIESLDCEIFDGETPAGERLLFDIDRHADTTKVALHAGNQPDHLFTSVSKHRIGGRTWTFITSTTEKFATSIDASTPMLIACAGMIATLLATGLTFTLLNGRSQAVKLAECMTADLATAKTEIEAALRETEFLHRTLNMHSIVSITDSRGRITAINDEFCRISGYSHDELIGKDHRIVNSGTHPKSFWVNVWRTIAAGEPWRGEVCNRAKDGTLYWVDSIIAPYMGSDGKVEKYVSIRSDITTRKKSEEQLIEQTRQAQSANRAKSAFLANMSHEIRTPLTAILGFADMLREERDVYESVERRTQTIDTIRSAGAHLLTVINDILDLSKIEAERMTIERAETELGSLLQEAKSMMNARAAGKGIKLVVRLDTPVPERIWSDPTRLRQILMNLVGNAIKFTETGTVTIAVRTADVEGADRLHIDVEDTGPGMTAEQSSRLFFAFAQADETVTRRHGGTGLGLTICRRLASLMNGSVVLLRTEPGKGSCFRVDLPLARVEGSPLITSLDAVRHSHHDFADAAQIRLRGRILLAEDGPDNQKLIGFHLRKAGATVEIADNGAIALRKIEQAIADGRAFDLLLTDVQMPEMDGHTLTRELRLRGNRMPVIALTAHAMAEDRSKSAEAGCDDYATKPIDKVALLTTCSKWLEKSGARTRAA